MLLIRHRLVGDKAPGTGFSQSSSPGACRLGWHSICSAATCSDRWIQRSVTLPCHSARSPIRFLSQRSSLNPPEQDCRPQERLVGDSTGAAAPAGLVVRSGFRPSPSGDKHLAQSARKYSSDAIVASRLVHVRG
jgi:hypothetical protein